MNKRTHKHDKLAKLHDAQILPLWGARFGRLLLRHVLPTPPRSTALELKCGTGWATLEVLKRLDDSSRIVAIDDSSPMLDEARAKAGPLAGKRVFFRSESNLPKLSFADEVYDLCFSNGRLGEFDDPEAAIREMMRVLKPGGQLVVALPIAGTYQEFFDLFREALTQQDVPAAIDRLDAYLTRFPPLAQAQAWLEDAGGGDITVEYESFELLFKSSREFFFAPIIDYGPLAAWKDVAGRGTEVQEVFWKCKKAIDTYFGDSSFAVSVHAACLSARRVRPSVDRPPPGPLPAGELHDIDQHLLHELGDADDDADDDTEPPA